MSAQPRDVEQDKKKVQDDKDFTSGRMSEATRYIGFGLAALSWTALTSTSPFAEELLKSFRLYILFSSFAGCLAIFFDYMQYFFGYRASEEAYQNIRQYELGPEESGTGEFKLLDVHSLNYRARRFFFAAKHVSVFVGMIIFISVLLLSLLRSHSSI